MHWGWFALVLSLAGCNGCRLFPRPFNDSRCNNKPDRGCLTDGRNGAFTCQSGLYGELPCEDDETCMQGECVALVCRPNYFWCDGNVADVCDGTGTRQTLTDCTKENKTCRVEALSAACVDQACEPTRVHCSPDGSEVRKCSSDGMSFTVVETCRAEAAAICVSGRCIDRCAAVDAVARTTLGCKLYGALTSPGDKLIVANPNEIDATVVTKGILPLGGVVPAGLVRDFSFGLTGPNKSGVYKEVIFESSLPVYAWIAGTHGRSPALLPALSTEHLIAVDGAPPTFFMVVASQDGTEVTATVSAPSDDGPMVSPAPAGGTVKAILLRGQALAISSSGNLSGSRVVASAPVVVVAAASYAPVSLPGVDRLGRDYVLVESATAVAHEAGTVTTQLDGTLALAAGQAAVLQGGQRISSTARLAVAGRTFIPPVAAWLASTFVAEYPGSDGELWITTESGTTKMAAGDGPFTIASPFFAQVDSPAVRIPLNFSLAPLP